MATIFDRIKNRRKSASKEIPTVPVQKPLDNGSGRDTHLTKPAASSSIPLDMPQLQVGCAQSVGIQRDHNEDALFTFTSNILSEKKQALLGLYIVADGMGGHKHGEIASALAISTISSYVLGKLIASLLSPNPSAPDESIQEIMHDSIQEAHHTIMRHAPGSGTTVTAVLILNENATLVHVGDSRAYFISKDGRMNSQTRDHSLVMRMMELGQLTTEEASIHPQRNVLYRALGQGEPFSPDITTFPLPDAEQILLCSDGLWGVVPENELAKIILAAPDPQTACQLMINAANAHGGPDNITAVLIKTPPPKVTDQDGTAKPPATLSALG